jgi:hypothetical protein
MQILFAISILCFVALIVAAIALTRHIRAGHKRSSTPPDRPTFAQHLFSAHEDPAPRRNRTVPVQTLREIIRNKSWNQPPDMITLHPGEEYHHASSQTKSGEREADRKAPRSSQNGGGERLDWAYFNKDLGDLSDPYQAPRLRANSRSNATSPKRF